jgi:outer membrane immunogenic protein
MRNTKLILSAALMFGALVGINAASAADLPANVYTKAPPMPVEAVSWTGFYIGAQAGADFGSWNWLSNRAGVGTCASSVPLLFTVPCDPVNQNATSWLAGGQAGYRWQTGSWVFGIEGSGAATDLQASSLSTNTPALTNQSRISSLYTGTAQAGYAWDRTLFYAKGGYAGAQVNRDVIATSLLGSFNSPFAQRANGWTIGAGLEYSITRNLSVGVEYDFAQLETGSATGCSTTSSPALSSVFCGTGGALPVQFSGLHTDISQIQARLNYRLDGPIVAKY